MTYRSRQIHLVLIALVAVAAPVVLGAALASRLNLPVVERTWSVGPEGLPVLPVTYADETTVLHQSPGDWSLSGSQGWEEIPHGAGDSFPLETSAPKIPHDGAVPAWPQNSGRRRELW